MSRSISSLGGILGGSVKKSFWPLIPAFPPPLFPELPTPKDPEPPAPSRLASRLACLKRPMFKMYSDRLETLERHCPHQRNSNCSVSIPCAVNERIKVLLATVPPILSDLFSGLTEVAVTAPTAPAVIDSCAGLEWWLLVRWTWWRRQLERDDVLLGIAEWQLKVISLN